MEDTNNLFVVKRAETTYWDERQAQKVYGSSDSDGIYINFEVRDLTDCPEDARIGRDLFDADDYISALLTGFKIANAGYDGIRIIMEDWDGND